MTHFLRATRRTPLLAMPLKTAPSVAALIPPNSSFAPQRQAFEAVVFDVLARPQPRMPAHFGDVVPNFRLLDLDLDFNAWDLEGLLRPPVALAPLEALRCHVPRAAAEWIQANQHSVLPAGGQVLCYTDGSFKGANAAHKGHLGWACAFLELCDQPTSHAQACLGVIAGGPLPFAFEAQEPLPAFTAECMALCFAAIVGRQHSCPCYSSRPGFRFAAWGTRRPPNHPCTSPA